MPQRLDARTLGRTRWRTTHDTPQRFCFIFRLYTQDDLYFARRQGKAGATQFRALDFQALGWINR